MARGMLLVLSGPSGVGKGTLAKELLEKGGFSFSVSCTTRAPRPGEIEGVHYFFLTEEEFARRESENGFLETALVHGHHYGTPLAPAMEALAQGRDLLLDIDPQGGVQVMKRLPEAVSVFLLPPSWEELERRLRGRGTETEEDIVRRLKNAKGEIDYLPRYRYAVVNDDIDRAREDLFAIARAERLNTARFHAPVLHK